MTLDCPITGGNLSLNRLMKEDMMQPAETQVPNSPCGQMYANVFIVPTLDPADKVLRAIILLEEIDPVVQGIWGFFLPCVKSACQLPHVTVSLDRREARRRPKMADNAIPPLMLLSTGQTRRGGVLPGFILPSFPLFSLLLYTLISSSTAAVSLPGLDYDYGAQPKFVCTPIPADADPSCFTPGGAAHGPVHDRPSSNGHHGPAAGAPNGISDEAKSTILHLRESLVRQKETILDQRETIRELTAKLTLCEGFGRGVGHHDDHHDDHHGNAHPHHRGKDNSGSKHGAFSPEQTRKTLQTLKERLENLQARNSSSSYSSSLRDLLQRKINALEKQLNNHYVSGASAFRRHRDAGLRRTQTLANYFNFTPQLFVAHILLFCIPTGTRKKPKSPDAFQIGFPMRTNYMYGRIKKTLLIEIFTLTVCLWIKGGSGPGLGTPFSYSVPGQANELVLIEWGNNPMELLVNDNAVTLPMAMTDGKWHHLCMTWSSHDGHWEAFQDGVKRGSGENLSAWHPIKPGGVFILGQEQDTLGGRFDATQSFVGEMSDLQLWSRVLTPNEIYSQASCGGHLAGDLISWTEAVVELHGGVTKYPFDPCH
ncbi:unnamed protein product [Oncorhynchus mykiss]|uniref:Pentraxin (PTX) domain-containing protein n=1 Tax=Oncorhynchus mykiss TaxID=8022 RepID=A0A060WIQ7_ONCMY|nr:unnamed protein product [Oncorhynchus mykiss]